MAEKKGLLYRLTMGSDNKPDFSPNQLPKSRWAQFGDIFRMRMGALVKINMLTLIFCLPLIIVFVLSMLLKVSLGGILPFSANIGVGYPQVFDINELAELTMFSIDFQMYLFFVPLIAIAAIGFSGAFHVVKRLVWGEGIAVAPNFFGGIKQNVWHFMWLGLLFGISLLLLMVNIAWLGQDTMHIALKIIGLIINIIQFAIVLSMLLFATTQTVTYKLGFFHLLKNSFFFAVGLIPITLFFLAISLLPFFLIVWISSAIDFMIMIGMLLFMLFGVSYIVLIWTLYAQFVYDKFINDRVPGATKNKGLYVKTPEERAADAERRRKASMPRFANPKKRKPTTSVTEGATFEPLAPSFSRADLARLAEEKAKVKAEIDAEFEEDEDSAPAEVSDGAPAEVSDDDNS